MIIDNNKRKEFEGKFLNFELKEDEVEIKEKNYQNNIKFKYIESFEIVGVNVYVKLFKIFKFKGKNGMVTSKFIFVKDKLLIIFIEQMLSYVDIGYFKDEKDFIIEYLIEIKYTKENKKII